MLLKRIKRKLSDKNFYVCFYKRGLLWILHKVYNFNKWHVNAPFECRKYKKVLVSEINKLDIRNNAVEIGGGLGDILSRVKVRVFEKKVKKF